jgi:hypothetical protein
VQRNKKLNEWLRDVLGEAESLEGRPKPNQPADRTTQKIPAKT